ncbi:unnamed protein product [Diabrotica balteata]|uniref:Uncharacterized protein n=1 Tax=Diabrotica balteata TaxID=107213 RepID=A0A9N9T5B0_DIABA|nr:unnamed protein product [Diabrotica balteata]
MLLNHAKQDYRALLIEALPVQKRRSRLKQNTSEDEAEDVSLSINILLSIKVLVNSMPCFVRKARKKSKKTARSSCERCRLRCFEKLCEEDQVEILCRVVNFSNKNEQYLFYQSLIEALPVQKRRSRLKQNTSEDEAEDVSLSINILLSIKVLVNSMPCFVRKARKKSKKSARSSCESCNKTANTTDHPAKHNKQIIKSTDTTCNHYSVQYNLCHKKMESRCKRILKLAMATEKSNIPVLMTSDTENSVKYPDYEDIEQKHRSRRNTSCSDEEDLSISVINQDNMLCKSVNLLPGENYKMIPNNLIPIQSEPPDI